MLPSPFSKLSKSVQKQLTVQKGMYIFREGAPTTGMFFIASGSVELRRYARDGTMIVIHTAKTGSTFAEASLFSDHYHCDAYALETSEIIEFNKQGVMEVFKTNSEFASELSQAFARQIQSYRRKIELLAIRNAQERVYFGLVEGLLQTDIKSFASEIGLTHEVVYRALSKLEKLGKIEKTGRGKFRLQHNG